jgi:hypothetical protein
MVEDEHGAAAFAGLRRTHHPGGSGADHHNVELIQERSS